jgi:pyridoxine kinase
MPIISIQSQVVAGHVGNSAAMPALNMLGHEVWAIPTVLLSHHPGHGGAQGGPLPPDLLTKLLDGMQARDRFAHCEAVISGYLGGAATEAVVADAVARVRAKNPGAPYLCDPVLGDDGRLYVGPDIVTAMRRLVAIATIVTPNAFELTILTGETPATRADAVQAMRRLKPAGIAIVTGFTGQDTAPATLDILATAGPAAWRLAVPRLPQKFSGAGDLFAALFLAAWLPARQTAPALAQAAAALHEVLGQTARLGLDELALLQSRHQMLSPRQIFAPERLA